MVENTALNPETPRRRRGRPSKQEEVRQALATVGCDPAAVDPLRILAGIAADESMPPTARVAACKALLAPRDPEQPDHSVADGDAVSMRAQQLLAARRRAN
jgi:hypothetical protein